MDEQIKRLLLTEKPFQDESFIGYILRITEMNAIPDFQWIYKLISPIKPSIHRLSIKNNLKIDREKFSRLFGITQGEFRQILYCGGTISNTTSGYDLFIHDQFIQAHYINQEKPKICSGCLREKNYCRRIWEFLPLVVCPFHKCLLIEQCQQCSQNINWRRPGISVCNCGFDFRQTDLTSISDKELRFGRYFCRKLKCHLVDSQIELEYPINGLSLHDLLRLLLFISTHLNGIPDITAQNTLANFSVRRIHKFISESVEVFDNWSTNFYQFINEWQDKVAKYNRFRDSVSSYENYVPAKYKKYELLISRLDHLSSENLEFLHYEFLNYLNDIQNDSVKQLFRINIT